MPRLVHYAAHGSGGLAFACFYREYERHTATAFQEPTKRGHFLRTRHTIGYPRRSTDLGKVTCRDCWVEIRAHAHRVVGRDG